MKSPLRSTGYFLAAANFAGLLFNLLWAVFVSQKMTSTIWFNTALLSASTGLFVASALVPKLAWVQPVFMLLTAIVPIFQTPLEMWGLGFFAMGILLLVRIGFFKSKRLAKALAMTAYFLAIVCASYFVNPGRSLVTLYGPLVFMACFILFLFLAYEGRIAVYLKEPVPQLSLSAKGLSPAECLYVKALAGGRTIKEIAFDYEITESTVRNTLARAYKKLDVDDKSGVAGLAGKFEIVD